jgi:signal transduction histidine kinase
MARLNKSLLLLTKIENKQFPSNEKIPVDRIIQKVINQCEPQTTQKHIHLQYQCDSDANVLINKMLLEIMISNLLGNAIRHNHDHGTIRVLLQSNKLMIQNTGIAGELNEQKIFSRFQKDSTDVNSLGLGLEIAKKICALYNFKINYSKEADLHSFQVLFA